MAYRDSSGLPIDDKAKNKSLSDSASAKSHRTRLEAFSSVNFVLKKMFIGPDALKKLAYIYEVQYGKKLDIDSLNYELLGDLVSFCINKCYNSRSIKKGKKPEPKVKAAMTPEGQALYRYYQMAMPIGGQDKDAMALVKKFNAVNSRGKPFFPHIEKIAPDYEYNDGSCDDDEPDEWQTRQIQALWNLDDINKQIDAWNNEAKRGHKKKAPRK
ncbi:hypothetical protein [Providencia alcalifaciens]|uniref:hypothetical protein n=1 Tax=Providencia alcalifaciens TaxID=126385 RepID=UPI003D97FF74